MGRLKEFLEKLQWSHVVLAIGGAAAFFYFTLDQTEIETRQQNIEMTKNEIQTATKKIEEAKQFEQQFEEKKKRYADLVKELQKLQGALPKQFFLPDLLSELLREAKQLEIEIISIRPDAKETAGELYNSLGFNIEAKGTFLQFFIFLDRMANLKRLVSIEDFNLEKDGLKFVSLGGVEGAFAATKLTGGKTSYPAVKSLLRVITYRYRGGVGGESAPPPNPQGGK
jgi:Tfp pilus assembly protein PilO